ncbi:MAG: vitamin B12 dependent-methionine synthase activation domain-containing protein, partial [Bacteroidota bacterium]
HVLDASRAVGVASQLLSEDESKRSNFILDTKESYADIRRKREQQRRPKQLDSLALIREQRLALDFSSYQPPVPAKLGVTVLEDYPLADLVDFIDWTPFFSSWQLAGKFPAILEDEIVGEAATKLYADARRMLDQIVREKWLKAKAVFGLFPAQRSEDDVIIYANEERTKTLARLHFLRQQRQKAPGKPYYSLADFVASKEEAPDYIGAFAVTTGHGITPHVKRFEAANDDYSAILLKALADRLAEAFAEHLHWRIRREYWGYAHQETLDNDQLIAEKYQGIRPAPGYPACPEHTEKGTLWELLSVEAHCDMSLTESYAMYPAASVSGWYFSHPESRYFGISGIGPDQAADYAARKIWTPEERKKWLGRLEE